MTTWVLGDQLTRDVGPLSRADADERVLMIEAHAFARKLPYHPHKLVLVFSAMRQFRDELRADGHDVEYHQVETFGDGLDDHFDAHPDDSLVTMTPAGHGAADRLETLVTERGGEIEFVADERFLCSIERFDEWAGDDERFQHEGFYRMLRRETGYLIEDGEPVGGEWNYDEANREFPGDEYDPPDPPRFEPDDLTEEVAAWVDEEFAGGYDEPPYGGEWADPGAFVWPVTREGALDALTDFVEHRLPEFGPYQDAMLGEEWALNHALLSTSMNLGLLHPREVAERALDAYREDDLPLASVEGFLRQVIGWREFMRHVYRRAMPDLATANLLNADHTLPNFYWTGDTEMACLADVVGSVRERGYSHHIERLMVLSNFALLYGVRPDEINRWFHAAYVDAYHWVTTPNVVGMGVFGSDRLSTKPYAASANYIDDMSDYCGDCRYAKTKTVGENACPFNALYWDFLGRNEDPLRENHRMGLVYSHWDDKDSEERAAIRDRVDGIRELVEVDDL
ncbi:cryptochrome/photolyase family protein [Halococcus salifodinae]|nr:cryptochrome/photolyase family protein [Halococcus salifodinae]